MAIMSPYIPSTPAMTTGMIDLKRRSGLSTATDTIPTPDLAVPYAEPRLAKTRAATQPMEPKKTAWLGSPRSKVKKGSNHCN